MRLHRRKRKESEASLPRLGAARLRSRCCSPTVSEWRRQLSVSAGLTLRNGLLPAAGAIGRKLEVLDFLKRRANVLSIARCCSSGPEAHRFTDSRLVQEFIELSAGWLATESCRPSAPESHTTKEYVWKILLEAARAAERLPQRLRSARLRERARKSGSAPACAARPALDHAFKKQSSQRFDCTLVLCGTR